MAIISASNKEFDGRTFRVLAINPGSTSTKVAVYDNEEKKMEETVKHPLDMIERCGSVYNQKDMRRDVIFEALARQNIDVKSLDAVVGRGGLLRPIESGTYKINQRMLDDLKTEEAAVHASSLGAIIAEEIGREAGAPSYVVDPIVVDEIDRCARLTGLPGVEKRVVFHALNQKAVARRCAASMGMEYENCRFIVAHLGGGVTIGAHRYGRVIDVNDALAGEGPFTPDRTGSLPAEFLIKLCFSGEYTQQQLIDLVNKAGGMKAYLGTSDLMECERMIAEGDDFANLVFESMAYQIAKEIGAMYAVLEGRVDAIIFTGGMAYSTYLTSLIKQRVGSLAPIKMFPGEDEMLAMVEGALRVLRGQAKAQTY